MAQRTPDEKMHQELLRLTRDVESLGALVRRLMTDKETRLAVLERRVAILERASEESLQQRIDAISHVYVPY